MSRVPPDRSSFVGYKCTNEDCLRVFSIRSALGRHTNHSSNRKTLCSNKRYVEAIYEINEDRASSSLQSSRVVTYPLSGDCRAFLYFNLCMLHRFMHFYDPKNCAQIAIRLRKSCVNCRLGGIFTHFTRNWRKIYAHVFCLTPVTPIYAKFVLKLRVYAISHFTWGGKLPPREIA